MTRLVTEKNTFEFLMEYMLSVEYSELGRHIQNLCNKIWGSEQKRSTISVEVLLYREKHNKSNTNVIDVSNNYIVPFKDIFFNINYDHSVWS